MVASKVTQKMVFVAASKLREKGTEPTAKKLLSEIGVGSLTTHSKYLKLWQQLHDNNDTESSTLSSIVTGLSSDTVALFESAIAQCWQQGYEQGQADNLKQVEQLKEQLSKSQQQLKQAQESGKVDSKQSTQSVQKRRPKHTIKAFQRLALGGSHASKDN